MKKKTNLSNSSSKVKMTPRWYKETFDAESKLRKQMVEDILYNVSCHGSLMDQPTEIGKQFVDWIRKEFVLIGFAPNTTYMKIEGKGDDLQATWVHPWAMNTLIYKNKKLPFLIYVNAGMRLNEMLLAEIPFNMEAFENVLAGGLTS